MKLAAIVTSTAFVFLAAAPSCVVAQDCITEASLGGSNACSAWLPDLMCCEGLSCQALMGCYPNPRQKGDPCSLSSPCRGDRCCGPGLLCVEDPNLTLQNVGLCRVGTYDPTSAPTPKQSESPSLRPSSHPTSAPTPLPSMTPTARPSPSPTSAPTPPPSISPTPRPSYNPTNSPTPLPSIPPTTRPSSSPTNSPTPLPSMSPTSRPSPKPSDSPTKQPTTLTPTSPPTLRPSPSPTIPVSNLALDRPALQSGTCDGGAPERANDGNKFPFFQYGSVSSTCKVPWKPWWRVQLDSSESIVQKVIVYNRMDCCSDLLSNAVVDILDDDGQVVATRTLGDTNQNVVSVTLDFDLVQGKFVRITKASPGVLSLVEVEVMGQSPAAAQSPSPEPTHLPSKTPTLPTLRPSSVPTKAPFTDSKTESTPFNLAIDRPASQSGTCEGGAPERANDGSVFPFFQYGSVSSTCKVPWKPWWRVELDSGSIVQKVMIYNRMDCCSDLLSNSIVDVLANDDEVVATRKIGTTNQNVVSVTLEFDSVRAKSVRITKASPGVLSLVEVKVMGLMAAPTPSLRGGDGSRDGGD